MGKITVEIEIKTFGTMGHPIVPPKSIERQLRGWLAKAVFGRSILIRKKRWTCFCNDASYYCYFIGFLLLDLFSNSTGFFRRPNDQPRRNVLKLK